MRGARVRSQVGVVHHSIEISPELPRGAVSAWYKGPLLPKATGGVVSFSERDCERLFDRQPVRRFPASLRNVMRRKLLLLDAAVALSELRVPPGNRLEKLQGDRAGQHSIRVDQEWRVCFRWKYSAAHAVEIVDYH